MTVRSEETGVHDDPATPHGKGGKAPHGKGGKAPRVWLLTGTRAGDRAQILALANGLDWPFDEKRLVYNQRYRIPNLFLGRSALSLDIAASSPLEPPWPDLVIASGRRSAPIARWIRHRSGGVTRLVHIGRPWAPLGLFDLIVTPPQYCLPSRGNVLHNDLALNRVASQALAGAAEAWKPRFADLPTPWIAVIVGGDARPFVLDRDAAAELGRAANALARDCGGSLLVTTSPRTRAEAVEALCDEISVPSFRHKWSAGGENPYLGLLALADSLIVTGDSASMLSESCATGKPVRIFALPERLDRKLFFARWFRTLAKGPDYRKSGWLARLYDWLVDLGFVKSTRDMAVFHENLVARGLAARLGAPAERTGTGVLDDMERTVERVRSLFQATGR